MSAPTLWEEGRLTVSRVARLAVLVGSLVLALDLVLHGRVTVLFDVVFVVVCLAAVIAVRPADFGAMAVLPPLLLVGFVAVLAAVDTGWVARDGDGWVQAVVSGLTHHATALALGYGAVLALLVVRLRVLARRRRQARAADLDQPNRSGSPAPTRVTSG